jgi:hypothetical protein
VRLVVLPGLCPGPDTKTELPGPMEGGAEVWRHQCGIRIHAFERGEVRDGNTGHGCLAPGAQLEPLRIWRHFWRFEAALLGGRLRSVAHETICR